MKKAVLTCMALAAFAAGAFEKLPTAFDGKTPVVVETKAFRLVINPDATARSLVVKATGEEMLEPREGIPVFATTQIRPFNNEIRLVQQAKRTTYPANRVRRDGDLIRVGFETAPYEVAVRVEETAAGYATFRPERLISNTEQEHQYWHWNMDVPPVDSFRVLQLPVKDRENFGDWLNVMWDGRGCVGVMGGTPYMDVDNERRWGFRRLTVESMRDYGVTNGVAVLAAAATPAEFLSQVDAAEAAAGMPRGVRSRRDSRLNASLYWTKDLRPGNVGEHIAYAKAGGFRMMLVYFQALVKDGHLGYRVLPDYTWGNGWTRESFREAVRKLNEAGITVGFHTLQTFIGFDSKYVTPEADHRLALVRHYTLSRPLPASEEPCDVYVEQNPVAAPMHPKCRILKFGTELMEYTGYVTERPYRFTGVRRRHLGTYAKEHPLGEIGGVLAVSECAAISSYVDQATSLQDEIGDMIADIYDCGVEFLYFDGSEDANPPCTVNISLSQIRCVERCTARSGRPPLFTEGCAKSHFGWHLQSGANAFDVFSPEVFKHKIIEYPYAAAKRLAKDFTRVDFGWWLFGAPVLDGPPPNKEGLWNRKARTVGVQADIWEYGTSKAAAFDCPSTMQMNLSALREHRRTADILETMRRWEDVRARKWLTPEQKEMLKDPDREFHLYLNEKGGYELLEWSQLDVAGGKWTDVRAFLFERGGKRVVAYWHVHDRGKLVFASPLDGTACLDAGDMKYFETSLPADAVRAAFASAEIRNAGRRVAADVPPRHVPKRIMGRDYWPAMYRYRDWLPYAKYDNSPIEARFDNPEIFRMPAFRDAAPVYWARNEAPPADAAVGTWRRLADNFRPGERDREILSSNPFPDRPFLFAATSKRRFWTWGAECDLDYADYFDWQARHPNALYDGTILEWDNDLMMAYGRVAAMTNSARRAKVEALIGRERPKTREERMAVMRRHYADRHRAAYGGKIAVHASHVFSQHLGGDCGADVLAVETTNTSGSPTNDSEYRWNLAPMFARGAARQFARPWEWYLAAYMNGFRTNGEWHDNAVCSYPAGPRKGPPPARAGHGPEYGTSASLMRRAYYFAYLSGANVTQPEEWSAYFLGWDEKSGRTELTSRGRDYAAYHDFTQRHPDRGVPYTPVAICMPLSRGYSALGTWAWATAEYGYTRSDLMSDAVIFSLVPGFERAKAIKAGVETNIHNSRFAQMYDVICPDAESQSWGLVLDVMKSYKALVVAGEFKDPKVAKCLAEYEKAGGRVVRLPDVACKIDTADERVSVTRSLKAGKTRFPEVEALLESLQAEYFPFKVEGDCLYGANRTADGWWLWVLNNRGVTKFTDAPHSVDHSFDAEIAVSGAKCAIASAKELLSENAVAVAANAFTHRVAAGDLAVFEITVR